MGKTKKDSMRYSKDDASKRSKKVYKKSKYNNLDVFFNEDEDGFDEGYESIEDSYLIEDLSDDDYSDGSILNDDFLDDEYNN